MLPIDARGLDQACARLYSRTARVIGWGTGSVFDYFHSLYPIRLDYLVDNDRTRWGQQRRGIEIASPERTAVRSTRQSTVIVIYSSSWTEIRDQIARIGDFIAIPATAAFADASVREKLSWAETIARRPRSRWPSAMNTIVVQGPVTKGVTAHVLRILTALNPDNLVLLSTWDDTDPELLAEAAAVADEVVTSAPPRDRWRSESESADRLDARGHRSRDRSGRAHDPEDANRSRHSGRVGVRAGRAVAAELRRRREARRLGLQNRLIVPSSYTRKYLLYHPSDLAMLGAAEDMARYWSTPLDPRSGELLHGRVT